MNPQPIVIRFHDGTEVTGDSPTAVLNRLGGLQWTPCESMKMKQLLAERVYVWEGAEIDPDVDDRAFLAALAETTLVASVDLG